MLKKTAQDFDQAIASVLYGAAICPGLRSNWILQKL